MFINHVFFQHFISQHIFQAESYEDARCKCVCTIVNGTEMYNKLFIANVLPSK